MHRLVPLLLLYVLTACAAPASQPQPGPADARTLALDTRCRTDADCTVKNVGSCCGASPACVNVASPTDPEAVMAQCQASGRMSVCGFREISACQCVSGRCTANDVQPDTLPRPTESPQPAR